MADVFISYKRGQRARIAKVAERLEALGLTVWFDTSLVVGDHFRVTIRDELASARAILVCWTPDCFAKEDQGWVRWEAEQGRARGILAPVLLEPTPLEPPFHLDHVEDLGAWVTPAPAGGEDEWVTGSGRHPGWQGALRRLAALCGRPGLPKLAEVLDAPRAEALKRWALAYPLDPMAEAIAARAHEIEGQEAKARTQEKLDAARTKAERKTAPPSPVAPPEQAAPQDVTPSRPTPTRQIAIVGAMVAAIAAAFFVWIVIGAQGEDPAAAAQAELASATTPDAYRGLIADYPTTPAADIARSRLEAMEARAWASMDRPQSLKALEAFVALYPDGAFNAGARALIETLQDAAALAAADAAWSAVNQNNPAAVRAFLADNPGHARSDSARTRLQALEAQAFQRARQENTVADYRAFIAEWPQSENLNEARRAIAGLDDAARLAQAQIESRFAATQRTGRAGCPPQNVVVYFDWDRSTLTASGAAVVDQAMQQALACRIASITISGHDDSSHSREYAMGVGARRANTVRDAIVRAGVPAEAIRTDSYGQERPAVRTPDGTREPLNRRAEVQIAFQ